MGPHAKSCAPGFPPVCGMVCTLLWQFPLSSLRPGWWTHPVFCVSPYRCRSILNSAAEPAYPAVPVISASAELPACQPPSLSGVYQDLQLISSLSQHSYLPVFLFLIWIWAERAWASALCLGCCHFENCLTGLDLHSNTWSQWLSTSYKVAEFDISFNSPLSHLFFRGWLFFSLTNNPGIYLSNTFSRSSPCLSGFFFFYAASPLILRYRRCLWRTGNETLFFPPICRSHPLSHRHLDSLQWPSLPPLMNSFCTNGEYHLISAQWALFYLLSLSVWHTFSICLSFLHFSLFLCA